MTPEERARECLTRVGIRKPADEVISSIADAIREERERNKAEIKRLQTLLDAYRSGVVE
jgi:hypothetical protein